MIENILFILNNVRENILESFIIPGLNISYWDFCISLLIVGLLITVLVNGVKSKGPKGNSKSNNSNRKSD